MINACLNYEVVQKYSFNAAIIRRCSISSCITAFIGDCPMPAVTCLDARSAKTPAPATTSPSPERPGFRRLRRVTARPGPAPSGVLIRLFPNNPRANCLKTVQDGLWLYFGSTERDPFVDLFTTELCGSFQNLLGKRSRFARRLPVCVDACATTIGRQHAALVLYRPDAPRPHRANHPARPRHPGDVRPARTLTRTFLNQPSSLCARTFRD